MSAIVGCLFCRTRGSVPNVHAHLRNHLYAYDNGQTLEGSEYHQMDIIAAWAHLTRARLDITAMEEDRVEVLLTFAKHITTSPMSKEESDAWRHRQHWPQNVDWWMSHIWEVEEVFVDSGRNPVSMRNKAQLIVCRSIRRSLTASNKPKSTTAATTVAALNIGSHADANDIGYRRNIHPPPALPARKKSAYRTYHHVTSDERDLNDDDEDDRRHIHTHVASHAVPPSTGPKVTETHATNSHALLASIISATGSTTPDIHGKTNTVTAGHTAMRPFLTIDLWGLDNRRTVLPIAYSTTLADALAQATPEILKLSGINLCFESVGPDWAGEWDDWRWDMVMEAAESDLIRVELRLVVVNKPGA